MSLNYSFPPIREQVLENGLRTIWLADHEQPAIEVTVQIPGGRVNDPEGKEGVSDLAANLMLKGHTGRTNEEYVDILEQAGASQFLDNGEEHTIFGLRTHSSHADSVVPEFLKMLSSPALSEKEFNLVKREVLTSMEAEYSEPSVLAGRHFQAEMFGRQNPSGRIASLNSIKRISYRDVAAYAKNIIPSAGSTAVVAGDCTFDSMQEKWRGPLSAMPAAAPCKHAEAFPKPEDSTFRIRLVDKPDVTQTTIVMGHSCVEQKHPAREALALANYTLGQGNFSSRLMKRIRSATGRAYGISSQIVSHRNSGIFLISTSTRNSHVAEVMDGILDVYRDLVENGITAEELEKAGLFLTGNLAFQLEGIGNVAEKLLWLRFFGYENEYIEKYASTVSAITVEQVNSALKNVFKKSGFVIAAVGKCDEIRNTFEKYGNVKTVNFRSDP